MQLFPEEQWESLLLGPGIDGPNGQHTCIGFTQESVDLARRTLSWHSFPSEDRPPESFFVFGEGRVLVPRLPAHQPNKVRNPFQHAPNLPLPPPAPFVPASQSRTNLTASTRSTSMHLQTAPGGHTTPQGRAVATNAPSPGLSPVPGGPPQLPDRSTQPGPYLATTGGRPQSGAPITHSSPQSASQAGSAYHQTHNPNYAPTSPYKNNPHHTVAHSSAVGSGASPSSGAVVARRPPANTSTGASSSHSGHQTNTSASSSLSTSKKAKKPGEYGDSKLPAVRATGISGAASAVSADGTRVNANDPGAPPRCPDEIAGYCRSWNIMHRQVCSYSHLFWSEVGDPGRQVAWRKKRLAPGSPEFDYIAIRFVNSWNPSAGKKPTVTKISQLSCPVLEKLFNARQEAIQNTGAKPNVTELYHGTCEANFATLFTQGFQPPADYAPHPQCPVSGPLADKVSTSLCKRTCRLCTSTARHSWNICHMWGLGIYCAIDSSKSDIYVSNKKGKKSDRSKRKMLLCSVILGEAENIKLLKTPDERHNVIAPAAGKHSVFAAGFKTQTIPTQNGNTLGVMNDEFVVFHPHQILPLYIIEYGKS